MSETWRQPKTRYQYLVIPGDLVPCLPSHSPEPERRVNQMEQEGGHIPHHQRAKGYVMIGNPHRFLQRGFTIQTNGLQNTHKQDHLQNKLPVSLYKRDAILEILHKE